MHCIWCRDSAPIGTDDAGPEICTCDEPCEVEWCYRKPLYPVTIDALAEALLIS